MTKYQKNKRQKRFAAQHSKATYKPKWIAATAATASKDGFHITWSPSREVLSAHMKDKFFHDCYYAMDTMISIGGPAADMQWGPDAKSARFWSWHIVSITNSGLTQNYPVPMHGGDDGNKVKLYHLFEEAQYMDYSKDDAAMIVLFSLINWIVSMQGKGIERSVEAFGPIVGPFMHSYVKTVHENLFVECYRFLHRHVVREIRSSGFVSD
jgi:hypothetical protein